MVATSAEVTTGVCPPHRYLRVNHERDQSTFRCGCGAYQLVPETTLKDVTKPGRTLSGDRYYL